MKVERSPRTRRRKSTASSNKQRASSRAPSQLCGSESQKQTGRGANSRWSSSISRTGPWPALPPIWRDWRCTALSICFLLIAFGEAHPEQPGIRHSLSVWNSERDYDAYTQARLAIQYRGFFPLEDVRGTKADALGFGYSIGFSDRWLAEVQYSHFNFYRPRVWLYSYFDGTPVEAVLGKVDVREYSGGAGARFHLIDDIDLVAIGGGRAQTFSYESGINSPTFLAGERYDAWGPWLQARMLVFPDSLVSFEVSVLSFLLMGPWSYSVASLGGPDPSTISSLSANGTVILDGSEYLLRLRLKTSDRSSLFLGHQWRNANVRVSTERATGLPLESLLMRAAPIGLARAGVLQDDSQEWQFGVTVGFQNGRDR